MDDLQRRANESTDQDPGLSHVASIFLPTADAVEPLTGRDNVVRVRHGDAWWKVRRWPEATPRSRVEFIHRVLDQAASGLPPVGPRVLAAANGETIVAYRGAVYDCQSWLPGEAVAGGPEARMQNGRSAPMTAEVPDPVFVEIMRTVATVHARTAALLEGQQPGAPPLAQLISAVTQAWTAQRGVLRPLATATPAVRRWLAAGERALPAAEAAFDAAGEASVSLTINHFGLWPAHVIVAESGEQGSVTGLIGWEHCNAGSPLIDIAQAVSRFRGWTAVGAEMAIAAYGDVLPVRPEDRRLLPAVAALDLIATSGQMLIFAYGGRPGGTRPLSGLRESARSLLDSLDVASNALIAQDKPKRPARDRRRLPGGAPRGERSGPKSRRPRGPQKKR